ncbi:unnamed protein product [Cyprideis torosa]|uniref:Uncharacterized protein n=1 Tax=Cyprideis torosa TaxID=163714 RepID=A0A7R8W178_9CRUS|nr:unnamed protein product [Cyprideis torosa]CAG0880628.1 unnamed protein product [Cyprideis torosa]
MSNEAVGMLNEAVGMLNEAVGMLNHVGILYLQGKNAPEKSPQEFSIFVIELSQGNKASYKECAQFRGVFKSPKALFRCNGGDGQHGQYVYIKDNRKSQAYFTLCEVEVFAFRARNANSIHSKVHVVVKTIECVDIAARILRLSSGITARASCHRRLAQDGPSDDLAIPLHASVADMAVSRRGDAE